MKIVFGKLKIKNFLSFDKEEFDFSSPRRMTLICGKNMDIPGSKNGCGKSAICSALLYALYGQLQNKVRNENMRNRYVSSNDMELRLDFTVDSDSYTIVRGLKGNSAQLKLYRNDPSPTDITKSSIAETDDFITNEILHCDITIFSRVVYLTSEQNYNFFKLRQQPKKEFIERLFNISIFGDMYSLIHKDTLKTEKELAAVQSKLLTLSNTKSEYEEAINRFEVEKRENVESLKASLLEASRALDELRSEVVTTEGVEEMEGRIASLNELYMKASTGINRIVKLISDSEAERSSLNMRIKSGEKMLSTHSGFVDGLCDDCRPKAREYFSMASHEEDIREAQTRLEEVEKHLETLKDKKGKVESKFAQIKDRLSTATREVSKKVAEAREHEQRVSSATSSVEQLKSRLEYEQNADNPYIGLMASVKGKIEAETENFNTKNNDLAYLELAENIVSQDSIKKFIVKDLVSLLNANIRNYLLKMGANFTCVFDENMDYEFRTDGGACEYDNFSSGEKMRLVIATSFAFKDFMMTRTNIESNVLVLDEFIDSNLDTKAINSILNILKEYSYLYNQSIYVISHRHEIDNSVFDNIIQVVKEANISRITYL